MAALILSKSITPQKKTSIIKNYYYLLHTKKRATKFLNKFLIFSNSNNSVKNRSKIQALKGV